MAADIVEIDWNARPDLERMGVNLRRGGIDDRGRKLLEQVRRSLPQASPCSPILERITVHAKAPTDDLRVIRRGVEQSDCLGELRMAIEHAIQNTACELV